MPFGNEASDFASSFEKMLSFGMGYQKYKSDKTLGEGQLELGREQEKRLREQTERELKLKEEAAPGERALTEAQTGAQKAAAGKTAAETEQLNFQNSKPYQEAFLKTLSAKGDVDAATAAEIMHKLDPAQVKLANAATQAEIDKAIADAGYQGAAAAKIRTEITPERLKMADDLTRQQIAAGDITLRKATREEKIDVLKARVQALSIAETTRDQIQDLINSGMDPNAIEKLLQGLESPVSPESPAATGGSGATRGIPEMSPTAQVAEAAGQPTDQAIPTQDTAAAPEPETPTAAGSPTSAQGRVIEAQAGTRNLPLNEQTRTMLEHAAAGAGLQVRVKSGAQKSTGNHRTGSHRHDEEVGAADIELIDNDTGKRLSSEIPEEQARIAEFMKLAQGFGATGFGAGREYMGDFTFHVGFGKPAIWGSDKTAKTAPGWLVAALGGGASPNAAAPLTRSAEPATTGALPVTSQSNQSSYSQTRPPVLDMGARSGSGGAGGATRDMVGQPQAQAIPEIAPAVASAAAPPPPTPVPPATAPAAPAEAPAGKDIGPLVQATEGPAPPSQAGQMMQAKLTPENQAAINDTANQLGIAPSVLAAVIGYETMGTFDAGIKGGAGGNYQGVIQFSPDMQQKYGVTPDMSFADQVRGPVAAYLKDRGLPQGAGLAEVYSVINAGSLNPDGTPRWDKADQNGDLRTHVNRISEEFLPAAEAMFGGPVPGGQVASGSNTGQGPTVASAAAEGGVSPRPAIPTIPSGAERSTRAKELPQQLQIPKEYIDSGQYAVDGVTAAKGAVKTLYAGATAAGAGGAVPTQQSQGALRQVVSGDGGVEPKSMRIIDEYIQKGLPKDTNVSQTKFNLLKIARVATKGEVDLESGTYKLDPAKQKAAATQIYQSFKTTANQLATLGKQRAEAGNMTEAIALAVKADAFIPDGTEILDFKQVGEDKYVMKVQDMVTKKVTTQAFTPQEVYNGIMNWNTATDFDMRIASMADPKEHSLAYERYYGEGGAGSAIPEVTYSPEGEPIPAGPKPPTNMGKFYGEGEAEKVQATLKEQRLSAKETNKQVEAPPLRTEAERKEQREQMARLYLGGDEAATTPTGEPKEYKDEMTQIIKAVADPKTGKSPRISALLDQVSNYNRDMTFDTIVPELAAILSGENPETRMGSGTAGTYGKPYERHPGKYEGTIGLSAPGSPVVINVPTTYAKTIMQAADARAAAFQESKRKDTSTSKGPKTWKDIGGAIKDQLGIQRVDPEAYKNPLKAAQKRASEVGIPMFGVNPLDQQMYDEMMK